MNFRVFGCIVVVLSSVRTVQAQVTVTVPGEMPKIELSRPCSKARPGTCKTNLEVIV